MFHLHSLKVCFTHTKCIVLLVMTSHHIINMCSDLATEAAAQQCSSQSYSLTSFIPYAIRFISCKGATCFDVASLTPKCIPELHQYGNLLAHENLRSAKCQSFAAPTLNSRYCLHRGDAIALSPVTDASGRVNRTCEQCDDSLPGFTAHRLSSPACLYCLACACPELSQPVHAA